MSTTTILSFVEWFGQNETEPQYAYDSPITEAPTSIDDRE